MSLRGALMRGAVAGLVGTAVMTGVQLAVRRARGERLDTPVPETWDDAPAPAQVVKKAAEAVGEGAVVTKQRVPFLTHAVHWLYGTTVGAFYGAVACRAHPGPVGGGAALGAGAWAAGYAELVPLGIYKPPWRYPPGELALDLGYHLAYGVAAAAAFAVLDR